MWNIFEQPWTGLVTAIIAFNVIAVVRWFVPLERKWQFIPPVAIALLGFGLCYLIETDREKVQHVIALGVKAVRELKAEEMGKLISGEYADPAHPTKKDFVRSWQNWMGEVKLDNAGVSNVVYQVGKVDATVTFNWTLRFGKQTGTFDYLSGGILFGQARIVLEKTAGGKWLIRSSELLEIMNQPTSWRRVRF
jgi:hypothetical protein